MIDCHNSYIKYLTKQMTNIVLYLYIVQSLWVIYIYILIIKTLLFNTYCKGFVYEETRSELPVLITK